MPPPPSDLRGDWNYPPPPQEQQWQQPPQQQQPFGGPSGWRAERRKKWPGTSTTQQPQPSTSLPSPATATEVVNPETKKRKLSISSEDLEDGEIEEDEEAKAQQLAKLKAMVPPVAPTPSDACQPPLKKSRKMLLCKWLIRGHCRFDAGSCRYSHDRSAFPCRSMMYKGSCAKGIHCHFSHDPSVLSGQRDRAQAASAERATEQQWRGEQRSLLRKLLSKDVRVEQSKMLQIVQFLVANDFLRSSNGEVVEAMEIDEAVGKTEVPKTGEMTTSIEASTKESIEVTSGNEKEIKTEVLKTDDVNTIAVASTKEFTEAMSSNETELKTEVPTTDGINTMAAVGTMKPIEVMPNNETELMTEVPKTEEVTTISAAGAKESTDVVSTTDKEAVEEKISNDVEAKPSIMEEPKPEVEI
ncbi:hypothetical protein BBO99_00008616 [Phytophthora kernoviae]|uniref:C3H1-type domain-containing protein n=1 Tax=Phytophthora kernoviae TaxID=325452 RepID=A0A3R7JPL2_9STRA|nr:hypothetical protein JM16_008340 [Phytophthora kernoviae]KAG2514560.1 hypothetical protein JM18_008332 [Phytophthora kernoviae]RLN74992.1 hypothetical protein BBO99_00008616 [Phytophthora kernoviae]